LSPTADSEINRLGVELVYIVGGTGVVSQQIEDGLKARGIQVIRLSGSSRYETSAAVASYLGRSEQAFVVSGENFPDALSIASYAASQGSPILLTASTDLPEPILKYLKDNGVEKTYIIGGDGVIPFSVSIKLPNPERISGQDRYQTNLEVLRHFGFDYSTTFLANGESFPDALSGSALAGVGQHPVILVSNTMNSDVVSELGYNTDMMKMKYVLGGTGVLPNPLLDRIFKH
jgi:putative cell wall-binding protein